jgi:hypothetical protein
MKKKERGVAIFAKACFGHPSPSKRQKLNAVTFLFPHETRGLKANHAMGVLPSLKILET